MVRAGRDRRLRAWLYKESSLPMNRSSRWGVWCVGVAIFLGATGLGLGVHAVCSGEAKGRSDQEIASVQSKQGGPAPAPGQSTSAPTASTPKHAVAPARAGADAISGPASGMTPKATAADKPAPAEGKPTEGAKPALPGPLRSGQPRRLAPGVLITIPPDPQAADTVTRRDVVELLAVDPKFDWAKDIAFRRDVFCLEFQFKPVRVIAVDLPQPSGLFQRKLVWYLVYCVTHSGKVLHPEPAQNGSYDVQQVEQAVQFVPEFVLDCPRLNKRYADRVIPLAFQKIAQREDPNQRFYNTVEMVRELKPGESVWGIATWEDIDPRVDRFSVYVYGLTNAYRWVDAEPVQPNDKLGKGRTLYRKALQLNFWRPGDEFDRRPTEVEAEIRFGWPDKPAYQWVFRPLGS